MKIRKSYLLPLLLSISFVSCSRTQQYYELHNDVIANAKKIAKFSAIADSNTYEIEKMDTTYSEKIKNLEEKMAEFEILRSKISSLENKISTIDAQTSGQQELLDSLLEKEMGKEVEDIASDQLFQEAKELYEQNEYKSSIKKFSQLLKDFPDDPLAAEAQYRLGECYYSLKQFDTAIEHLDKVLINFPNSEKVVDAKLKIAFCLADMGEYEGALTQLKKIQKKYPYYEKIEIVLTKIQELENR